MRDEARAAGKYDAAISAEHKRGLALGYYIERRESGAVGAFQAKTREEADRVLEETIAKIAAKQAIERAKAKPESLRVPPAPRSSVLRAGPIDGIHDSVAGPPMACKLRGRLMQDDKGET